MDPLRNWMRRVASLVVLASVMAVSTVPTVASTGGTVDGQRATFEGTTLNLAEDWGEARACLIWNERGVAECFGTEAQMDQRIAELEGSGSTVEVASPGDAVAASTCSSYVRLYDGTGYSGTVLYLRDRFQWLNLYLYGFSNRTSSYKIGACSSYFADYTNGGGDWYPTNLTVAYAESPSMISGWNNRVSSVYLT